MTVDPRFSLLLGHLPGIPGPVQEVFARHADLAERLAKTPDITDACWEILWDRKHKGADMAEDLVARPLTAEQVAKVLATEKRSNVLFSLAKHNPPSTADELDAYVAAAKGAEAFVSRLYVMLSDHENPLAELLGPKLSGLALLGWAATADPTLVNDEKIIETLATMSSWFGASKLYGQRSAALKALFANHPSLLC